MVGRKRDVKILDCFHVVLNSDETGCYYWTWDSRVNKVCCGLVRKPKPCPYKEDRNVSLQKESGMIREQCYHCGRYLDPDENHCILSRDGLGNVTYICVSCGLVRNKEDRK